MHKKEIFLSILCGIAATLTLPPIHFVPLLIPAFSGLFLLLRRTANARSAFWVGWAFGLGYFATGLYWFAHSLMVDAEKFAWMIPFAVLGLPSLLAIYYGLAGWVSWKILQRPQHPFSAVLSFAFIWIVTEYLRGHLLTGFPWNLIAGSWMFSLPMMQPLGLVGVYGYSWWTLVLATLPAIAVFSRAHATAALSICLAMLLLPLGYGVWRLEYSPPKFTETVIKLVQPSTPQVMRMRPEQRIARIEQHVALSKPMPGEPIPDLILWSEAAYPFFFEELSPPVNYIVNSVLRKGSYLITGADLFDRQADKIFNSMQVVGAQGEDVAHYDKIKLVPFGEYAPLRWLLPIEKIVPGMRDFSAGEKIRIINLHGIPPFLPLICYEVIFPEMAQVIGNAQWMLNITNDAWFGVSSGPYQHFAMARMRTVEQGIPLVRVANNGISAVIDGAGRIVAQLPLNKVGSVVTRLPEKKEKTLYAHLGDTGWIVMVALLTFISRIGIFWRKPRRD